MVVSAICSLLRVNVGILQAFDCLEEQSLLPWAMALVMHGSEIFPSAPRLAVVNAPCPALMVFPLSGSGIVNKEGFNWGVQLSSNEMAITAPTSRKDNIFMSLTLHTSIVSVR